MRIQAALAARPKVDLEAVVVLERIDDLTPRTILKDSLACQSVEYMGLRTDAESMARLPWKQVAETHWLAERLEVR